jgi:alanine-glyoxylate transaminase/serine-glyoxylate transaminase/serine-pyruvate transaminase
MDLADPRVDETIAACEDGLRRVLGTRDAQVFMYSANGHGAWEAVLVNIAAPGQTVLMAGTGHFSEAWALQAEDLGVVVQRTPWVEGQPIDPGSIEAALRADVARAIVAVLVVHTDTASGITSDVPAIRAAMDASGHPALLVVDGVASVAAAPLYMDAWGANVVLGASQKGLMVPPGLAYVAADARALAVAQANPMPRHYWAWQLRVGSMSYRKFCGTPPETLLFGLRAALGLIEQEGLEAVWARHARLAAAVHAAVEGWREAVDVPGVIDFFCPVPAARSVSVTAITVGGGHSPDALRQVARERFQVAVAGGLGPLAGRVFRIGHLGDLNEAMLLGALGGVQAAMGVLNIPHGDGVGRAIAYLSRSD